MKSYIKKIIVNVVIINKIQINGNKKFKFPVWTYIFFNNSILKYYGCKFY